LTGSDPYLPGHGDDRYGVDHYALDLRYKPLGNHLEGRAELSVRALVDLTDLVVDLHRLEVRSLRVEGARVARWSHRGSRLRIRLAQTVAAGEPLLLTIAYRGNPGTMPGPDGPAGWEELADGVLVAAQPHGAPTWFPCNDRMADKARYRIRVETDPAYRVVANGVLVSQKTIGRRAEWVHEQREPMAPYLATLQIGRYVAERQPAAPVETWLVGPQARMPQLREALADQPRMLEVFTDLFGPYPFERYTAVVTDDPLEIPLESQSLSTFGSNHRTRDWAAQRLVAHELSHQWFGNAVTAASLSDIWLHEGFACYAEWLWSQASGRTTVAEEAARHHDQLVRKPQDLLLSDPGPTRVFDDRVYKRGALTLRALHATVGDDVFFRVLRTWVETHRYEVVTTADFEATVAAVTGSAHTALFDAWLRSTPLPALPDSTAPTSNATVGPPTPDRMPS
jgi:aminopeptidase N